jgi:co-chaperonin GroES (HSP10)
MNTVEGKLVPLNNNILVTDMNFDEQKTASGIIIRSDDGKAHGVKPRWCKVWAVGPEQHDVKVGEWVLVEHGRWTRGVTVREDGNEFTIRRVDPECVLISSDDRPNDVYLGSEVNNGDSMTIRPEDFGAR